MIISSKNSKTRVPMSILSIVLCIALITAVVPHFLYNNDSTQDVAANTSQTKYANITEFQNARWTEIQNAVFDKNYTSIQNAGVIKDLPVKEGNAYFNWTNTSNMQGYDSNGNKIEGGLKKYSGTPEEVTSSGTITEKYADSYVNYRDETVPITSQASYTVYDVYTADQFAWVLNQVDTVSSIKLNLLADIDMGGADNNQFATGKNLNSRAIYIEGNGHTVYNLKMYGTSNNFGIYSAISNAIFIANNLGFQSVMLLHNRVGSPNADAGLFYGYSTSNSDVLFNNVHIRKTFYQQSASYGDDIGMGYYGGKGYYRSLFFNNSSSSDGYIYGISHVGGMFSASNTNITPNVKYDVEFPNNPMAFVYSGYKVYPIIFNNSYTVDCEMFSTGDDSGAFTSCGRGIMAINCFTNNTIYSRTNTGGFIGRVIESGGRLAAYDSAGNGTIGSVFRNCYSAGIVEGQIAMGGFTGLDCGYRSYVSPEKPAGGTPSTSYHTVYDNCYSTAMVGMDYTGKYCGGFVGLDDNYAAYMARFI